MNVFVYMQEEEEESDEEGPIYNPLNLPLGWDGKPIPYWLYKLHGLGVEFKCEICGDFIYKGRRYASCCCPGEGGTFFDQRSKVLGRCTANFVFVKLVCRR